MAFKPGDVVVLKSGGPAMTVASVEEDDVKCLWIGEEGELFREDIPAIALELIETEDDLDEIDEDEDGDEDGDEDEDEDERTQESNADAEDEPAKDERPPARRIGR